MRSSTFHQIWNLRFSYSIAKHFLLCFSQMKCMLDKIEGCDDTMFEAMGIDKSYINMLKQMAAGCP